MTVRRSRNAKTLALGDFVDHIVFGTGVVLTMSEPPFSLHWVEHWNGRGPTPTATDNGFLAPAQALTPAPRPAPLIRRKRA